MTNDELVILLSDFLEDLPYSPVHSDKAYIERWLDEWIKENVL